MWPPLLRRLDARWLLALSALVLVGAAWTATLMQLSRQQRLEVAPAAREARDLARRPGEPAGRAAAVAADDSGYRRLVLQIAGASTAIVLTSAAGLIMLFGRLMASRDQAHAASRAKSRFLSNMSHELRTPLNGILGYAGLLQAELGDGPRGDFAGAIRGCGVQLLGLVDAVLELSALESGHTMLALRTEALGELAQSALVKQRASAAAAGLALELTLDRGVPRNYVCDRAKLSRILDILLRNAVDATAAGTVRLQLSATNSAVTFRVHDSGRGVPAALRARLFEPFSTADDSSTRAKDGAGLGLAIAARLARMMGGRIVLERSGDNGSVFAVSLPYPPLPAPVDGPMN